MWFPTQDEAVEMYARFLAARYGKAAGQHARETADRLLGEGDFAGYAILSATRLHPRPGESGKRHLSVVKPHFNGD